MKRFFLFLLVSAFIFSCKKANESPIKKERFIGTWEYEGFIGPFFNKTLLPGNGKIIILRADNTFERRSHDTVEFKGTYTLQMKKDCCERKNNLVLTTSEQNGYANSYIEIENEKLRLSTSCCYQDGGVTFYRKIE